MKIDQALWKLVRAVRPQAQVEIRTTLGAVVGSERDSRGLVESGRVAAQADPHEEADEGQQRDHRHGDAQVVDVHGAPYLTAVPSTCR